MKHMYMNVIPKPDIKNNTTNRSKNTRQEIHKNIHIYIFIVYMYTPKNKPWNFPNDGFGKGIPPFKQGQYLGIVGTSRLHRSASPRSVPSKCICKVPVAAGYPQGEKNPLAQKRSPMGLCQCLVFKREKVKNYTKFLEVSIGCNTV